MKHPVVAIDGPAASGKSSIARELATRLNFAYVNTGEMYRAVTWKVLQENLPLNDAGEIAERLPHFGFVYRLSGGKMRIELNGTNPVEHVRDESVNQSVSIIAAQPIVRAHLVAEQRRLAEQAPLIMEGRDIGTAVFPETPHKFFVDADPDVRAQRRRSQGENDAIAMRDRLDSTRATAPLKCAVDAIRIDSSHLSVQELAVEVIRHLKEQGLAAAQNL